MQGKNLNANSQAQRPARLVDASGDRICYDPKVKIAWLDHEAKMVPRV